MQVSSPGSAVSIVVDLAAGPFATSDVVAAIARAEGTVTALHTSESTPGRTNVEVTCNSVDDDHVAAIVKALSALPGAIVGEPVDLTFQMHIGGKLTVAPKQAIRSRDDLAQAYTPGVARVSRAIAEDPAQARRFTIKRNTVAVVSDGSAVLGLGNVGPAAALPVMEGKAVLFKQFADVDAWPVCLDTQDTDAIVAIVKALAPVYGGINLEDIAAPRCFEIERRLRAELDIPVFHDDQHGTAIVVLAALTNSLRLVGKRMDEVKVVISGTGAAGNAIVSLLLAEGATRIVACDRQGALHPARIDLDEGKRWIAESTNPLKQTGTLRDVLVGADVFIGVSGPGLLTGPDIATMATGSIVFALANPDPEVAPQEAAAHASVVATGRSDYPNQINNVLAFPGLFRGMLDAEARHFSLAVLRAAANAIAGVVSAAELSPHYVVPSPFDPRVVPAVADAVRNAALLELASRR